MDFMAENDFYLRNLIPDLGYLQTTAQEKWYVIYGIALLAYHRACRLTNTPMNEDHDY